MSTEIDPSLAPLRAPLGPLGVARAWLELARLSNAPTVVSNVLAGFVLGGLALFDGRPAPAGKSGSPIDWPIFAIVAVGGLVLYTAGMVLNDAKDAVRDAESRPTRPIPSGRIGRRAAWVVGLVLMLLAIGAGGPSQAVFMVTIGIVIAILLYTWLHAGHAWACVFMGLCRVGLYALGATAVAYNSVGPWTGVSDAVLIFGCGLGLTTVLITHCARTEASAHPHTNRVLAWSVVFVPLCAPLLADPPMIRSTPSLLFAVGFALWGSRCARAAIAGKLFIAIPGWLAGFCLYDAMVLSMHGRPDLAGVAAACFVLTVLAQRVLPGT